MTSNYDEFSMHQSLHFSDNLKDLKDLRSQLYSAAEYFEISYANDDQKQAVVETLKDYVVKSVVTTLDHLGTFFYKMNDLLKEKAEEASGTELRISCLQQRLRTCQEYIDREGVSQQSLIINIPKYHKRYILPVGEKLHGKDGIMKHRGCSLEEEDEWEHLRNAVRATIGDEAAATAIRKGRSRPPSPGRPLPTSAFTISTRRGTAAEKRSVSPYRFPLLRTGSISTRKSVTPGSSRPTTPIRSTSRTRGGETGRRSVSIRGGDGEGAEEVKKSRHLLKSLLSRRKHKKDDTTLYTYLDEY